MAEKKHVLVIAPPRSGNHTATKYYRSKGYDVRLLQLGEDGIVSWFWYKDHHIFDWHTPKRRDYEFENVILLLRDPIKSIRSMSHLLNPYAKLPNYHFDIMEELLGEPLPTDSIAASLKFWTTIVRDAVYDEVVYIEEWDPPFHENPHPRHNPLSWKDLLTAYPKKTKEALELVDFHGYPVDKNHHG